MIISASRRTDLPAFYPSETIDKILACDNVECVVFWTKDARPIMEYLPRLQERNIPFYFQYTLTSYKGDLEPVIGRTDDGDTLHTKSNILENMKAIARQYGSDALVWRYDPIILTNAHLPQGLVTMYTWHWHIYCFEEICRRLKGYTNVCIISFVDIYNHLKDIATQHGFANLTTSDQKTLACKLADIARNYGIQVQTCAEYLHLPQAKCIDPDRIVRLTGKPFDYVKDPSQRKLCGCTTSVDIGSYEQECFHHCVYCYARQQKQIK